MENDKEAMFQITKDVDGIFNSYVHCADVAQLKLLFFNFATDQRIPVEARKEMCIAIMQSLSQAFEYINHQSSTPKFSNDYLRSENTNYSNHISYDN